MTKNKKIAMIEYHGNVAFRYINNTFIAKCNDEIIKKEVTSVESEFLQEEKLEFLESLNGIDKYSVEPYKNKTSSKIAVR